MKEKYAAYYAAEMQLETFKTFEEAEKWLKGYGEDDGFLEETESGENWIAKITHRSKVEVLDKRENYHEHNDNCPENCEKEEWPYNNDFDYVGKVVYEEVQE